MTFIYLNEYLLKFYSGKSVFTHLIDTGYLTKNGNKKFNLKIYDRKTQEELGKEKAIELISKKTGFCYYTVILNE